MASETLISVVSPVYGSPESLAELCKRIVQSVSPLGTYEIILVFDCSRDNSWEIMRGLAAENPNIKCLHLSRNFGQHYAITAGLDHAHGKWVVVMDCDLQDQPEEIPKLYSKALEGYDSVFAQRKNRQDSYFKRAGSYLFFKLLSYMTDAPQDASIANFGIYHHQVIRASLAMGDHVRSFPLMVRWVGFRQTAIPVEHAARVHGTTTYSIRRLIVLAATTVVTFSNKPLRLTVRFGFGITGMAAIAGLWYLIAYLLGYIKQPGFASLIISIWFLGGMNIMVLGIVSAYLGQVFDRVKERPIYIVRDSLNLKESCPFRGPGRASQVRETTHVDTMQDSQ